MGSVMPLGKRMPCNKSKSAASIRVEGSKGVDIGSHVTTVEDGDCIWGIDIDGCKDDDATCAVPQYVSSSLSPLEPSEASEALQNQEFVTKSEWGPWDALNNPPIGEC